MNEIEIKNKSFIERNSKINEGILKSYDIMMEQQNKMDNKAFIFVGFLSVILGVINKEQILNTPINWILCISILLFTCSMLPIANKLNTEILKIIMKKPKKDGSHNIFYYLDIFELDIEAFKQMMQEKFHLDYITEFEMQLMEQILINAKILRNKINLHNWAYLLLFGGTTIYALIMLLVNTFFASPKV